MFRRSVWCLVYLGLLLISFGCEKSNVQYQQQVDSKQKVIEELKLVLTESNQKVDELLLELAESNQKIDKLQSGLNTNHDSPLLELEKVKEEFPWLKKLDPNSHTKWDKVVISFDYPESPKKTIEDPIFLNSLSGLLYLRSVNAVDYPSGYQSDIDTYVYELYENGEKYSIKVVDRGVIEAGRDQLYFEVDLNIHQLGAAFMPKPWFIKHDGLIAKIAASGALKRGDQFVQLSPFRMQLRIGPLIEATLLKDKPAQIGDRIERYIFYYYGTELVMEIYKEHVHLTGDGAEEWYYHQDAYFAFTIEPG